MKKILFILCAVAMLAGTLCGCNSKETVTDGEKINLRFSFWEASTGKEAETTLQKIVDSYEKDHPNVHIKLVSQANSGYQDWIKAQMATNSLPEIQMNSAASLIDMGKNGLVEDISDAFDSPNKYYEDKIWKETFVDGSLDSVHEYRVAPAYNIPLFGTGIAMFYNKDIYKDLGLEIPENWDEFIENCKVIEEAGIDPIAYMGQKEGQISWTFYELSGDLYIERWLDNENLNYNNDNHITKNEIVKAIDTGDFNIATDKEYQEDFKRLVEYFKKYIKYAPNAMGYDEAAAKMLFLSGKAAHLNTGSWDIAGLINNEEVTVDVGVFKYPKLTKDNSQYAGKGISNNCYQSIAISSTVNKQEGARDAAIDFVKYLTSPEQYKIYIDGTKNIPSIKGIDVDDVYDSFIEEGYPLIESFMMGSSKVGIQPWSIIKEAMNGKDIEFNDELFAGMQESMKMSANNYIERNKLSKENNYMLDDMPIIGGVRK